VAGASIPIDAVTSLGRDVNNTIVVEDPAVAAQHAVLTYRGHAWYLEEQEPGMRPMLVNGEPVEGGAALRFGDEIALGRVRLRLERPLVRGDG
jgi:pSer/pThr/pTyr-binding forkhead associated (FHA) protein